MARLNQAFLRHHGPTDVITFDHSATDSISHPRGELYGELFVSPAVAQAQAPRYRTTGEDELTRHIVHGLLHLAGETDQQPRARQAMKKLENLWLHRLRRHFPLQQLRLKFRTGTSRAGKTRARSPSRANPR
jgi:rRNA maturation RNase YbeY